MFSWSLIWACVWQYNQQIMKYHGTVEHMLLHYSWRLSEYGIIRFDMWKASIYVLKNIFYIFAFIIIYINPYMFRYYTGMLCFLIKYLRILINFSLLTTILATLNEEIEFLKQIFQRSSPSLTSNMVQARFEPGQNLSRGFAKWCWAVVTNTTPLTTTPHSWICWIKLNNPNSRNWVCHTRRENLINYLTSTFTYSITSGRWKPFRYSRYVIQINIINV